MDKANGSVNAAEACPDTAVLMVDKLKREDNRKRPIHGRQREHGSDSGEEPFPSSVLEAIGAVSSQKFLE